MRYVIFSLVLITTLPFRCVVAQTQTPSLGILLGVSSVPETRFINGFKNLMSDAHTQGSIHIGQTHGLSKRATGAIDKLNKEGALSLITIMDTNAVLLGAI